ncbi:MAG TPA: GNAT family N-acetyltransferase [Actinomycetes bacterium]|nr:GNAT family N-acetyltransferase [Actinomycetes bacterium]
MRIRPGGVRDIATFTRLVNAHNQWLRGEDLWREDELSAALISTSGDPVDNDRYVEVDGEVVAALHVQTSEPYTKGTFTLAIPPIGDREAVIRLLLDAGERIVRAHPQLSSTSPIDMLVPREDTELIHVATNAGYRVLQKVTMLEADVFDAPAANPPADVDVVTFSVTRDLDAGYEVIRRTFPPDLGAWHMSRPNYEYCMRNDPTALPGLSIIARDTEGPVGLALNFLDTTREQSGFTAALGVLEHRRGEGIGRAIALESFDRFRARGWQHARMATILGKALDDDDYGFYTDLGMQPVYDDLVLVKD